MITVWILVFGWIVFVVELLIKPIISHTATHRHNRPIINRIFQLNISLFLNGLSILEFFDKLHFEHFHLHNFGLFLSYSFLLLSNLPSHVFSCRFLLSTSEFGDFGSLYLFLLPLHFHFYFGLVLRLLIILFCSIFSLLSDEFCLLSLLFFMHQDSIGNFWFFSVSFISHSGYPLTIFKLALFFGLPHLHFRLFSFKILLLQPLNISSTSSCFFDFFPSFHLLLFQKCNTICQKLSVSLSTMKKIQKFRKYRQKSKLTLFVLFWPYTLQKRSLTLKQRNLIFWFPKILDFGLGFGLYLVILRCYPLFITYFIN